MRNLCIQDIDGELDQAFWQHIYNIGGGESCRVSTLEMYRVLYGKLGITNLDHVIDPKWYATRNFHGQYYLDSDKLEDYFHFRRDTMEYFYQSYLDNLGALVPAAKVITKLPGGQKFMGAMIKRTLKKQAVKERGTLRFIEDNDLEKIDAYWGSKANWETIPEKLSGMKKFSAWNKVIKLDHGYDENKPASELNIEDMKGAATFRGGECLSTEMETGNWTDKIDFKCAFGHTLMPAPNWFWREDISARNVSAKPGITKNVPNASRFSPKCGTLFKARMMAGNMQKLFLNYLKEENCREEHNAQS